MNTRLRRNKYCYSNLGAIYANGLSITLSTLVMFNANAFLYEREIRGFAFLSCMDLCAYEIMNRIFDLTNLINIKC